MPRWPFSPDAISNLPQTVQPYIPRNIQFLNPEPPIPPTPPDYDTVIDLYKTPVMDSTNTEHPGMIGHFGDLLNINPDDNGLRLELAVAQVMDSRAASPPLTTSGSDAKLSDVFTVGPLPSGVTASGNQKNLLMLDATGGGIYATTDANEDGAEVDLQYDPVGQKVGAGTAFLQSP